MGLAPVLHRADMATFALDRQFGLIFCVAGSLTLLAEPGQMEAALDRSRAHLAPSGVLALAMDAPGPQVTGAVIARDLRREPDGARLRCILDPLPDANPELARWRMSNEVIAQDGGALRETVDIAFRRPDPARFADMLHVAGFRDITLMDETGTSRIRENEETYLVLARPG